MNMRWIGILCGSIALAFSAFPAMAQNNYLYAIGDTNFGVNIPIEDGFINVSNGEVHLEIPLATQAQRGNLKLDERLVYDSRIWMIGHYSNYYWWPSNVPNSSDGWRFISGGGTGTVQSTEVEYDTEPCADPEESYWIYGYEYTWTDSSGVAHPFGAIWQEQEPGPGCNNAPSVVSEQQQSWAEDESGYQMVLTGTDDGDPTIRVLDMNGAQVYPSVVDRFGNEWTADGGGNLVDDLGRTPVETTTVGNQTTYSVLTDGGSRANYVVTMEPISVQTNFGQQAVHEWSGTLETIQSIALPDGSSYSLYLRKLRRDDLDDAADGRDRVFWLGEFQRLLQ